MAATADTSFHLRGGSDRASYGYRPADGVRIFRNAIVAVTANFEAVPAGHAEAVAIVGVAESGVDNRANGANDRFVYVRRGVFKLDVSVATAANVNAPVFAADDDTLQLTDANGALRAGVIDAIDAEGVWVNV